MLEGNNAFDVAIIGGGILGVSLAYFLSSSSKSSVLLIEQHDIASHTSSRNTGKVHAPFLYDPEKKKHFAKAAFLGFDMWKKYCELHSLPFKQDGVLEVATNDKSVDRLHKYLKWGYSNGLKEDELRFLEKEDVAKIEPNVKCLSAIHCSKDGSVNYGAMTRQMAEDAKSFGCNVMQSRVRRIERRNGRTLIHTEGADVQADYVINAAGGNAVDIAHHMGSGQDYMDLHFRGEYWEAPKEYHNLTKMSIYSVPKYPEYPFLDPHWIVRADGRREVGPNAVPVFSPYGYDWRVNAASYIPKIIEIMRSGARKMAFDTQFLSLAINEVKSSLSKNAMIERATEFLPQIKASHFHKRGTAGIRSSLVGKDGKFVPDTMFFKEDGALHILNYNSPGATGALPIAAMLTNQLSREGIVKGVDSQGKSLWDIQKIAEYMLA